MGRGDRVDPGKGRTGERAGGASLGETFPLWQVVGV